MGTTQTRHIIRRPALVQVKLSEKELKRWRAMARETDVSLSECIRTAMRLYADCFAWSSEDEPSEVAR